jgi:SnoaL-like domain
MTEWAQERMLIEHECAKLVVQFFNYNDARNYKALAELFVEDGVFARPTDPANPIKGRETILARFEQRPKELLTRHIASNIEVTAFSREMARGFCLLMLYTGAEAEGAKPPLPAAPQALIGSFNTRFTRTIHGWRIAEHIGALSLAVGPK